MYGQGSGSPSNFKTTFICLDLLTFAFDRLTSKAYYCCARQISTKSEVRLMTYS